MSSTSSPSSPTKSEIGDRFFLARHRHRTAQKILCFGGVGAALIGVVVAIVSVVLKQQAFAFLGVILAGVGLVALIVACVLWQRASGTVYYERAVNVERSKHRKEMQSRSRKI